MKLSKLNGEVQLFYTLQGEGLNVGKPAVFIRSALCNLACSWCDTPHTWDWSRFSKDEVIADLSNEEVVDQITSYPCQHMVITGGEPLLQQPAWVTLFTALNQIKPYTIEIETNGTLIPSPELDQWAPQYNVSPKLTNSGNDHERRLAPDAFSWFVNSEKSIFKFVVTKREDAVEIIDLIERFNISKDRVFLMPEGETSEQLALSAPDVAAICMAHGFRFSDRLHIRLKIA